MGLDGVSGGIGIYMVDTIGRLHHRGMTCLSLAEGGGGIGIDMDVCANSRGVCSVCVA